VLFGNRSKGLDRRLRVRISLVEMSDRIVCLPTRSADLPLHQLKLFMSVSWEDFRNRTPTTAEVRLLGRTDVPSVLALQKLTTDNQLWYEPFGMEHMVHFPKFFDTVFCMGILYHHRDPVGILRMINESMTTGGQLIVECQGIPGEGPYALFPEKTYGKVKGTYFLPTAECLSNWLKKACGQLLSERLMRPGGVEAVLKGFLVG